MMRLTMSGLPPAAVPTRMRIGRDGHSCAKSGMTGAAAAKLASLISVRRVSAMGVSSLRLDSCLLHGLGKKLPVLGQSLPQRGADEKIVVVAKLDQVPHCLRVLHRRTERADRPFKNGLRRAGRRE